MATTTTAKQLLKIRKSFVQLPICPRLLRNRYDDFSSPTIAIDYRFRSRSDYRTQSQAKNNSSSRSPTKVNKAKNWIIPRQLGDIDTNNNCWSATFNLPLLCAHDDKNKAYAKRRTVVAHLRLRRRRRHLLLLVLCSTYCTRQVVKECGISDSRSVEEDKV